MSKSSIKLDTNISIAYWFDKNGQFHGLIFTNHQVTYLTKKIDSLTMFSRQSKHTIHITVFSA
jgi:hypothetical protein